MAAEIAQRPQQELQLRGLFAPESFNDAELTAEVVWTAGARVRRSGWPSDYLEELSLAPGHVRLDRLNGGAPLLDSHNSMELSSVIGVVESAWVANGEGRAMVRFSKREEVQPIVRDVQAGILRNVSVGYRIHKIERDETGDAPVERAIDWEPYELSLVPIPADAGAQVRSNNITQGDNMTTESNMAAAPTEVELRKTDLKRFNAIIDNTPAENRDEVRQLAAAEGIDAAYLRSLDLAAAKQAACPTQARFYCASDDWGGRGAGTRASLEEALLRRLKGDGSAISVAEVMEAVTGRRGRADELLQRVMTTTDFPALFAASGFKLLRERYESAGTGARLIARRRQSADLRDIHLLGLSDFPAMQKLLEGGEIRYGNFTDRGGSYRVEEYARGVNLTRRSLLSDELDAFGEALSSYGRAIAALEDDLAINALESGATGAKCLEDGKALFHSDHQNSATGTNLTIESLAEATRLLRQTREVGNGRALNLTPRWLLVPASHEVLALQLCTAINATSSSSVNPFGEGSLALEPIVDANLSGSHAYVLADPSGPAAAIEICTGPAVADVQSQADFDTTSVKTRVLADRGLGVRDHRGIVRIPLS